MQNSVYGRCGDFGKFWKVVGHCLEEVIISTCSGPRLLIQGRSGTGKTTVLERRALWHEERSSSPLKGSFSLIVTVSSFLAASISEHYAALRKGARLTSSLGSSTRSPPPEDPDPASTLLTPEDQRRQLAKRLPHDFRPEEITKTVCKQYHAQHSTLVLTYNLFLRLLDASIRDGEQFFRTDCSKNTVVEEKVGTKNDGRTETFLQRGQRGMGFVVEAGGWRTGWWGGGGVQTTGKRKGGISDIPHPRTGKVDYTN